MMFNGWIGTVTCIVGSLYASVLQCFTLCLLGNFCAFLSSADFFQNQLFRKTLSRITIRMLNSLDPDQARQNVGPDLGPNCLQRLSADGTRCPS